MALWENKAVLRWARLAGLQFVVVTLAATVTACSPAPAPTSAAPPTRFCDQTLVNSAAGSTVTDATSEDVTVNLETAGGVVLRTSLDCTHGASIEVDPPDALQVTAKATTKDGKLAAVALQAVAPCATIAVTHAGGSGTKVHVALQGCLLPTD